MLDVGKIKKDFPIFRHHPDLVYLDSAATSLKPQSMIDALVDYYSAYSSNIKRGIYRISEMATEEYEKTRDTVASLIGAKREEIIFTRSTTESLNAVTYSLGRKIVDRGDEIVVSVMEHHSNFVPWQQLAFEAGADFKVIDITDDGFLNIFKGRGKTIDLGGIVTKKTKILALSSLSNVLGTVNPIRAIADAARSINPQIVIVVDVAQTVPRTSMNIHELGADFIAFSSHKMLGPTGVGILWGKKERLEEMFPFQYGGGMIESVTIAETTFAPLPEKFEAGTPAIAEVIAFRTSIEYLQEIGFQTISTHEKELTSYAYTRLREEFENTMTLYGPANPEDRESIISFGLKNIHSHDIAAFLDKNKIAVRAGHHCTMPLHDRLGVAATTRISLYLYNTKEDIDKLIASLKKAVDFFS